jgi:hypothetical protein
MPWRREAREHTVPFAVIYLALAAIVTNALAGIGESARDTLIYMIPSSYWFRVDKLVVESFAHGEEPYVQLDRTVSHFLKASPTSEIRVVGKPANGTRQRQFCAGTHSMGPFDYDVTEPQTTVLKLNRFVGDKDCARTLPCGTYQLSTSWSFEVSGQRKITPALSPVFVKRGCSPP